MMSKISYRQLFFESTWEIFKDGFSSQVATQYQEQFRHNFLQQMSTTKKKSSSKPLKPSKHNKRSVLADGKLHKSHLFGQLILTLSNLDSTNHSILVSKDCLLRFCEAFQPYNAPHPYSIHFSMLYIFPYYL
jgi:hypothetical protein